MMPSGSDEKLSYGSFNLRKFLLSSSQLENWIDEREATLTPRNLIKIKGSIASSEESFSILADPVNHPGEHKVLGVRWDIPKCSTSEI